MTFSRLPYNFEEALAEVKSWRAAYKPPQKEWTEENVIAWCSERAIKAADKFNPDWDTEAVLVEEMQRMAKRIEELESMPKEVDVKHKTKYYALLKEYDRVCYLLDKATDKITDQDLMLTAQTARIVDLQTHIENFDGEE